MSALRHCGLAAAVFATVLGGSGCLTASSGGLGAGTDGTSGGGQTSGGQVGGETTGSATSGWPVGAVLTANPSTINFGYMSLGRTAIGCTVVTNTSSAALEITGVASFDNVDGAFALSQIDDSMPSLPAPIPVSIAGGASVEICFSFTPPISQDYNGQATLTSDDPDAVAPTLQLTGWGGGPQMTCSPLSIAFGWTLCHSATTIPILCTNTGSAVPGKSPVIEVKVVGPGASAWKATFDNSDPDAGLNGLAPGQSFQIDLTYVGSDGGSGDATLIIELVGTGQEWKISLTGCGGLDIPPCQFVISPTSIDFANARVGDTSAPLSFEIANVGTDSCKVQGLAIDNDATGSFHILATSIAADPSTGQIIIPAPAQDVTSGLTVTLDFAPTQQGSTFSAEAAFSISDPSMPNQVVPLSGSSESTCLIVTPNTLNFGDAGVGDAGQFLATPSQSFSVSNQCQNSAQLESITLQSLAGDLVSQYSPTTGPTLPALIAAGSSLSYGISCAPTAPGAHPAQLAISDGVVATLLCLTCSAP